MPRWRCARRGAATTQCSRAAYHAPKKGSSRAASRTAALRGARGRGPTCGCWRRRCPWARCLLAEAQIGSWVADIMMVECKAQVNGPEVPEKASRIKAWHGLWDWQLAQRFDRDRPVLLLPGSWWSEQHEPGFESIGWWQKPTRRARCKQCAQCEAVKQFDKDFYKMRLGRGSKCLGCKGGNRSHWSAWFSPMQIRGMLADDKQVRVDNIIVTKKRVREAVGKTNVL